MSLLKSATLVLASNVTGVPASGQNVAFGSAAHDDTGFFDPANPALITIPEGVTRVQLMANATVASPETGVEYFLDIQRNGAGVYPERAGQSGMASAGTAQIHLSVVSPVIEVEAGEIFAMNVRSNGAAAFDIKANGTSFSIQAD